VEISKITGLPAHPLLVHVPVVLVPLMGLFAIVLVAIPRWRQRFLPVLVIGAGLAWVGSILAAGSGEELEGDVRRSAALRDHTQLGDAAQWITLVFFLVVLGWWAWERWGKVRVGTDHVVSRVAAFAVPVIVVLSALLATGWLVETGHSGAKATWEDKKDDRSSQEGLGPILSGEQPTAVV
jgi:uncharacterized membrane protein